MRSPRYTILIANRQTGVVRRFTLARRPAILSVLGILAIPVLVGFGARWAGQAQISSLEASNTNLSVENDNYRTATDELATQISSLQSAIDDIGTQAQLDPTARAAVEKLPAVIRSRAMGGGLSGPARLRMANVVSQSPETTFGVLRDLLGSLDDRLSTVRKGVEGQQALAAATPDIWPVMGWLSSHFGMRTDPITGQPDFHPGLDISADRGTPIHATADGTVTFAAFNDSYGNCIEVSHGYGISTRFGHLSRFAVSAGDQVKRGDVIGYVGNTGRSTGAHLHYEILLNGQAVNPLKFLGWR